MVIIYLEYTLVANMLLVDALLNVLLVDEILANVFKLHVWGNLKDRRATALAINCKGEELYKHFCFYCILMYIRGVGEV